MTQFHNHNIEITASPYFRMLCPKHRNEMKELANGFFSSVWWCEQCKCPYELVLRKMTKWNQEAVDKQLSI